MKDVLYENITVPIVFATNDTYAPYLSIAIHSLVNSANKMSQYDIYILYTELSDYYQRIILRQNDKTNITIRFIDIADFLPNLNIPANAHFTVEATYRLICGKLFAEHNKIIYLDCDIIVQSDIALLYLIDIGSDYIASVRGYLSKFALEHVKKLPIPARDYFNSGVLLINTRALHDNKMFERGMAMLAKENKYVFPDQDVLNILCHKKVYFLPNSWNAEWMPIADKYASEIKRLECIRNIHNADIIHYSSSIKPWNHPELPSSEIFWNEARQSDVYEQITGAMIHNIADEHSKKMIKAQRFVFPWDKIPQNAKVIIYGAGAMGQNYLWQLSLYDYCHVVAVCDQDITKVFIAEFPLISPSELVNYKQEYDYIIISVCNEITAREIASNLAALGISIKKLVHINYRFNDM